MNKNSTLFSLVSMFNIKRDDNIEIGHTGYLVPQKGRLFWGTDKYNRGFINLPLTTTYNDGSTHKGAIVVFQRYNDIEEKFAVAGGSTLDSDIMRGPEEMRKILCDLFDGERIDNTVLDVVPESRTQDEMKAWEETIEFVPNTEVVPHITCRTVVTHITEDKVETYVAGNGEAKLHSVKRRRTNKAHRSSEPVDTEVTDEAMNPYVVAGAVAGVIAGLYALVK